jgi:hypothetical protein
MLAFLLLLSAISFAHASSDIHVEATGYSAIVAGNETSAYEQAKRAALREAVEEGMGVLLSSQTLVENFVALEDHILTSTSGYVRSFDVVEHGKIDASTYQVKIEATVALGELHRSLEALDLLIESAGNPYIVILSQVPSEKDVGTAGLAMDTILREMLEKTSAHFNFMTSPTSYNGETIEDAARFGLESGADIVIRSSTHFSKGAAKAVPYSRSSLEGLGLHSAVAALAIDALWTDTGEVFSSHVRTERAAASSLEEAGRKALYHGGEVLADSLVRDLVENWRQKVYSGRLVRLVVQASAKELSEFESDFSLLLGGVEKMYRRSYSDGVAIYDIRSKNTGFSIARQLTAYNLERFDIVIQQVTPNSLKLQVTNKL